MDTGVIVPWGLSRVTDRLPTSPPWYADVVLDPVTQTARYLDQQGQVIEAGKHGTNRSTSTTSKSGGGDGETPQQQVADDSTTDYEQD